MTITIYGIRSTADNVTRYVGQSADRLSRRLANHLASARHRPDRDFSRWLLEEIAGGTLEIYPICSAETPDEADSLERVQMAAASTLCRLFNVRRGGMRNPPHRLSTLLRPIEVRTDDNATLLITCPSLPEVTTFAETPEKIVQRANDAIEAALWCRSNRA